MNYRHIKLAIAALLITVSSAAFSGSNDPLFINLSTDELHRSSMAINFGKHHSASGHPLTIFLNDKAVMMGVKAGSAKFADQQQALAEVINNGALVIMCPMCLKQAGFTEADLIPGVKLGGPKITGDALFKDGTKTMSW
ncbi:DsrE family protein [Polynucleobacter sp. 31A-FELB]|jgi:sulfur relay (sulfurtransferase) complex TusBCD TusD component (DsrE family)|uniref:DsrE family protein n=1 Tax=Polynucleobacter sp. 31A-FELB TaxID=2689096 RepID=UPI001C0D3B3B|nr:DsrE family protein [Polynucleobacter sp. 31A-FELB]MBU3587316.1 DsrE family protein [Polynucleobacter sp. 31A-FELB]